jgi:hypothetical protein
MLKLIEVQLLSSMIVILSITGCQEPLQISANADDVEQLYVTMVSQGDIVDYVHTLLLSDYTLQDLDSAFVSQLIENYVDTLDLHKPAIVVRFFNSADDLDLGGGSSDWDKVGENFLFQVSLERDGQLEEFAFISEEHPYTFIYQGENWSDGVKAALDQ